MEFIYMSMPPSACSWRFNRDSAWGCLFKPQKLVHYLINLVSNISSAESNVNVLVGKVLLFIGCRSMEIWSLWKRDFFPAVTVLVLLYGYTTRNLSKHMSKKLNGNYTRMLRAVLNKFWKLHKTVAVLPLTSHLRNPSSKTTKLSWCC